MTPPETGDVGSVPAWIQTAITGLGIIATTLAGIYGFMRKRAHDESRVAFENRDNNQAIRNLDEGLDKIITYQDTMTKLIERLVAANEHMLDLMREDRTYSRFADILDERIGRSKQHSIKDDRSE